MDQQRIGAPAIELKDGTLRVSGKLESEDETLFEAELRRLVDVPLPSLVVDLSEVVRVSSSYVRDIALAMIDAKKKGKSVTLRAPGRIARILRMGGLDRLGSIEVTEER